MNTRPATVRGLRADCRGLATSIAYPVIRYRMSGWEHEFSGAKFTHLGDEPEYPARLSSHYGKWPGQLSAFACQGITTPDPSGKRALSLICQEDDEMTRTNTPWTLLSTTMFLAASLSLSGCGGSSSDPADDTTPSDNDEPTPATIVFEGKVTDEPIANADVRLLVDGKEFETSADENGQYTLEIRYGDLDPEALVEIRGTGTGDQDFVEFITVPGSLDSLLALSQATDEENQVRLTAADYRRMNVTNVSSTRYVLSREANDGEPFASELELIEAEDQINTTQLLEFSAMIKVFVDDPDASFSKTRVGNQKSFSKFEAGTTLTLLEDKEAREQSLEDVKTNHSDSFELATDEIINDEDVIASYDEESTPPVYRTHLNFRYGFIQGDYYEFDNDGRGFYANGSGSTGFDWTLDGSKVQITFDAPVTIEGFCRKEGFTHQVRCISEYDSFKLTMLDEGVTADALVIERSGTRSYPDEPGLDPESVDDKAEKTGTKPEGLDTYAADEFTGTTWAMPTAGMTSLRTDGAVAGSDRLAFTDETNGTGAALGTFNWSVSNDRVAVEFGDNSNVTYSRMKDDGTVVWTHALLQLPDESFISTVSPSVVKDPDYMPTGTELADRIYAQHGNSNQFQFQLDAGGTGANQRWDQEGNRLPDTKVDWQLVGTAPDQRIEISYWHDPDHDFFGREADCPSTACFKYHTRIWHLMAERNRRLQVEEILRWDFDGDGTVDQINRRPIFYGIENL